MKKILFAVFSLVALTVTSCSNGSVAADKDVKDSTSVDSAVVVDSVAVADSVSTDSTVVSE